MNYIFIVTIKKEIPFFDENDFISKMGEKSIILMPERQNSTMKFKAIEIETLENYFKISSPVKKFQAIRKEKTSKASKKTKKSL